MVLRKSRSGASLVPGLSTRGGDEGERKERRGGGKVEAVLEEESRPWASTNDILAAAEERGRRLVASSSLLSDFKQRLNLSPSRQLVAGREGDQGGGGGGGGAERAQPAQAQRAQRSPAKAATATATTTTSSANPFQRAKDELFLRGEKLGKTEEATHEQLNEAQNFAKTAQLLLQRAEARDREKKAKRKAFFYRLIGRRPPHQSSSSAHPQPKPKSASSPPTPQPKRNFWNKRHRSPNP